MKPIVHILITTLICLCQLTYSQTIKTKSYFSKSKGKPILLKIEEFDKNGNLTKETECQDRNCSKVDIEVRIYNDKGQLIEDSIYTNKWGYHQLIWHTEYTYYSNGDLKTEKKVNETCPDGFDDLNTYYYDSIGRLIKIHNQNKCDNEHYFDYPIYFKYDSLGNQIEKIAKKRDTSIVFYKNVYQFDKNNNLISDTYYFHEHGSLELSSIREYHYDSLNRLTKEKWIISETNADSTSYTYYDNGLIKSEIRHPKYSDERLSWFEYSYDKKNNLIERQLYYLNDNSRKRKGFKELFEYEYY
jgi:hypothetical protein